MKLFEEVGESRLETFILPYPRCRRGAVRGARPTSAGQRAIFARSLAVVAKQGAADVGVTKNATAASGACGRLIATIRFFALYGPLSVRNVFVKEGKYGYGKLSFGIYRLAGYFDGERAYFS